MKTVAKYFGMLHRQSLEAAREAARVVRGAGCKVLINHENAALEIEADAKGAELLRAVGIFAFLTSNTVKKEHVKSLDGSRLAAVESWNARFSDSFRKSKRAGRALRGLSWAADRRREPAPHSEIDHLRLREALSKHAERLGIRMPRTHGKAWYRTIEAEQYKAITKRLRDLLEDETLVYHLARALVKLPPWAYDIVTRLGAAEIKQALDESKNDEEDDCWKMHGHISVGIIFIDSGRDRDLRFSASERNEIKREIIDGLSWLAAQHPSNDLSWDTHAFRARLDIANGSDDDNEEYFTLPAIGAIEFEENHYEATSEGRDRLREDLREADDADHAMLIFVTTFNVDGVLFTQPSRHYIVLSRHDDWKGWGRSALDAVTIHETCHVFGAADEYTSNSGTPCDSCAGHFGCDRINNGNCGECARPQQTCAMNGNDLRLCAYTKGQIGWSHLFVELFTDDEWLSGTDDDVEIDIGHTTYNLDTPDFDDRETNNREGYAIWDESLTLAKIRRVLLRKSPDGFAGGWRPHRIKVRFEGELVCDETIDAWIENDTHLFKLVKGFPDRDPTLVNELKVRVKTADVQWAGTDDDVFFKTAGRRWQLDSSADDFERNSKRTYEIDPGTGLHIPDISTVTIEKSGDGLFGGWKLGGLRVTANGQIVYDNQSINRWLEGDSRIFTDDV